MKKLFLAIVLCVGGMIHGSESSDVHVANTLLTGKSTIQSTIDAMQQQHSALPLELDMLQILNDNQAAITALTRLEEALKQYHAAEEQYRAAKRCLSRNTQAVIVAYRVLRSSKE
jgi:hypothetical protein